MSIIKVKVRTSSLDIQTTRRGDDYEGITS